MPVVQIIGGLPEGKQLPAALAGIVYLSPVGLGGEPVGVLDVLVGATRG